MIFGNIRSLEEYLFLEGAVKRCFEYAGAHDLSVYETVRHDIDGDRLFVNIVEYETVEAKARFWEAHKEYLDIHLMLDGAEQIDLNFVPNMEVKDYVPQDDFLPMEGVKNGSVILRKGDFLICYPNDAHRTAVAVEESEKIKKAIFKVRI